MWAIAEGKGWGHAQGVGHSEGKGWGHGFASREGNGTPLQYSCLENPMDGEAW